MATKKTAAKTLNSVEKILAYLNKNQDSIGAIVLCAAPKAGKKMPCFGEDEGECDGITCAADLVGATNQYELESCCVRSHMTTGLASFISQKFQRGGGLFG